jgi:hypothetical protein
MDILSRENLWFAVSGDDEAPSDSTSSPDRLKWKEKRLRAAATLRLSMEDKVRARYTEDKYFDDPVLLWEKIKADHKEVLALDEFYLRTQLFDLRLEDKGTVTEYLSELDQICDNLLTCGTVIGAKERWFYTLHGLPSSWAIFSQITG